MATRKEWQLDKSESLLQVQRTCEDKLTAIHHGSHVPEVWFLREQDMIAPVAIVVPCCEDLLEHGTFVDAQFSTLV